MFILCKGQKGRGDGGRGTLRKWKWMKTRHPEILTWPMLLPGRTSLCHSSRGWESAIRVSARPLKGCRRTEPFLPPPGWVAGPCWQRHPCPPASSCCRPSGWPMSSSSAQPPGLRAWPAPNDLVVTYLLPSAKTLFPHKVKS